MKRAFLSFVLILTLVLSLGIVAYADWSPLSKGDYGDAVLEVQQMLKDYGYLAGSVDGVFGNGTFEAVSAFQRDNGLEVTGVVGEATYNALLAYVKSPGQKADNDGVTPTVDKAVSDSPVEENAEIAVQKTISHPGAVIIESDCDLEITKAGFSTDNGYLFYAVIMHNNSKDKAIQFPSYRFTARGGDNSILGTGDQVLNIIYPGQDYVWGGLGCDISGEPNTVEFEVVDPDDYNIISLSQLDHPEYTPLVVENTSCKEDSILGDTFVGEVYNPNDYDLDMVGVIVLLKDASGTIIGGEMSFIDSVKAGRSVPFEVNGMSNAQYANYEIYANSWM